VEFREELHWILDCKNTSIKDEAKYKLNIDFVHSLGLKCDSVGWSTLDLGSSDADVILNRISTFCKENSWKARGVYIRTFIGESDWYELRGAQFKETTVSDVINVPADNGKEYDTIVIKAYHELIPYPKEYSWDICVPERFRNACIKSGVDADFCWVTDKGKYEAEQYFYIYPRFLIPRINCDKGLKKSDESRIRALGGYLPILAKIFHEIDIQLPDCYFSKDLTSGITYAHCKSTDTFSKRRSILIHKDIAETLIKENVLSEKYLKAVPALDFCPEGYTTVNTKREVRPTQEYMFQSLSDYEKNKSSNRPKQVVSEKEALKIFRKIKYERKEDFCKKIPSKVAEDIYETDFAPLLPYYNISNGGSFSDEYEFLSYSEAMDCTEVILKELKKEDFFTDFAQDVAFSKCADGDVIMLKQDGSVIRISHETHEIIDAWKTLALFVIDAII